MGWVKDALCDLALGRETRVRPQGGRSMAGLIEPGQVVTLMPVQPGAVSVGDVVLVRWKGNHLLHLVKDIDGNRVLIGNNLGKINGWVPATDIVAKATAIGD